MRNLIKILGLLALSMLIALPASSTSCGSLALEDCSLEELCASSFVVTKAPYGQAGQNLFDLELERRGLNCFAGCADVEKLANDFWFMSGNSERAVDFLLANVAILGRAGISIDEFMTLWEAELMNSDDTLGALKFSKNVKMVCIRTNGDRKPSLEMKSVGVGEIPRYDVNAYCENVKEFSGGSNQIYNSCIDAQQEAYNSLKRTYSMVPVETAEYCDEVAEFSGGSYQILKTCIEQENTASSGKKKFKY